MNTENDSQISNHYAVQYLDRKNPQWNSISHGLASQILDVNICHILTENRTTPSPHPKKSFGCPIRSLGNYS